MTPIWKFLTKKNLARGCPPFSHFGNFWAVLAKIFQVFQGNVRFFSKFFKVSEMKLPGKTQKNQFLSFPIISSSNEPRGYVSHWGMNTSAIGQCHIFSIFSKCQKNKLRKIHEKNQFLSFPNIFISNEPRGRANHWEINSFGIGKSQIFSKFL